MSRARFTLLISFALAAALALAACGGDSGSSGGDEDPVQVLRETFENEETIESGVFDFELSTVAEGGDGGSLEIDLSGPFQGGGKGIPRFDVDAEIRSDTPQEDIDFAGGLISTGSSAVVNYQDADYSVPQELFDRFATTFTNLRKRDDRKQDQGFFQRLGIDPRTWLAEVENEGTEEIEGTDTVHVSGSADVRTLLEDLQRVAREAGPEVQPLTKQQIDEAEDSVKTAELDVYSGSDDRVLRRLSATIELEPAEDVENAPDKITLDFSLTLSEVNDPQTIAAPAETEPLARLLETLGIDPRVLGEGRVQGGLGGELPQAGGSTEPPSDGATQDYLDCLGSAEGVDALRECNDLIQ